MGCHVRETTTIVGSRSVHAWVFDPRSGASDAVAVFVPGLGLPRYGLPTLRALAGRGVSGIALDVPGFGSARPRSTAANIHAVGLQVASWLDVRLSGDSHGRPIALIGHSTGAQAALTAAVLAQHRHPALALVMAGPTFPPDQRRWGPLVRATLTAYRDDTVGELHPTEFARGRWGLVSILRSAMADAPDERLAGVTVPVSLTAGVHDTFAPRWWLQRLAESAIASPRVRTVMLGGSHNNLFTHPEEVADVVVDALTACDTGAT